MGSSNTAAAANTGFALSCQVTKHVYLSCVQHVEWKRDEASTMICLTQHLFAVTPLHYGHILTVAERETKTKEEVQTFPLVS